MFIVSAKFNPKKAVRYLLALGVLLVAVILLVGRFRRAPSPGEDIVSAATDQERAAYLESLGWTVDPAPIETLEFSLPQPLNEAYESYNQLQLEQGFDLAPYAGMQVTRYSYAVQNYPGFPDQVQADLYLCGDTIIGGDILYYGDNGFVSTLQFPEN